MAPQLVHGSASPGRVLPLGGLARAPTQLPTWWGQARTPSAASFRALALWGAQWHFGWAASDCCQHRASVQGPLTACLSFPRGTAARPQAVGAFVEGLLFILGRLAEPRLPDRVSAKVFWV